MRSYPIVMLMLVALAAACGGPASPPPRASQSPGPALVVERFLLAASANELETMTQLFGSKDRTIVEMEGQTVAEQRMYVLASLLRHNDWSIQGQRTVPGRMQDATELLVEIERDRGRAVVPFLVVRRSGGGWIIERIDVESLTAGRGG